MDFNNITRGAYEIAKELSEKGHKALFAGGFVRDMFLKVDHEDIDIATDAHPAEIQRIFKHTIPVGERFGVILVIKNGVSYEVATFRSDGRYYDGRHPEGIEFSDEIEDAKRRDFTINGMFFNPVTGKVIDYVGGEKDLDSGIIRTIGDPLRRLEEDKLRVIRGIRFAGRFNFRIEPKTWRAIVSIAPEIVKVSSERIRDEILKILTQRGAGRGMRMLIESGVMKAILPEVVAMKDVPQPEEFHPEGDVLTHTLLMIDMMRSPSPPLALAVLLHDIGKPKTLVIKERIRFDNHANIGGEMTEAICRRIRISTRDKKAVVDLVKEHLRFIDIMEMRESKLKRFLRREDFEDHLELHRLDCLGSHGNLGSWEYCRKKIKEIEKEDLKPKPLIRGKDLIDMGFIPGPLFKEILTFVEDAQLEGRVTTKEEAKSLVRDKFPAYIT